MSSEKISSSTTNLYTIHTKVSVGDIVSSEDIQKLISIAKDIYETITVGTGTPISDASFLLFRHTVFSLQEIQRTESFIQTAQSLCRYIFPQELVDLLLEEADIAHLQEQSSRSTEFHTNHTKKQDMVHIVQDTQKALQRLTQRKKHEAVFDTLIGPILDPQVDVDIEHFLTTLGLNPGDISQKMMEILYGLAHADDDIHSKEQVFLACYQKYCTEILSSDTATMGCSLEELQKNIAAITNSEEKNTLFMLMMLLIIADDSIDDREIKVMKMLLATMKLEIDGDMVFLTFLYAIQAGLAGKKDLSNKNEDILELNKVITEKIHSIESSIKYAARLQEYILPSQKEIQKVFPDSFTIFKPRDIVSGDFSWIHANEDGVYMAAADCTGHGVPGAFLYFIMYTALQNAVHTGRVNPADILTYVKKSVTGFFMKDGRETEQRDGMEIPLCRYYTNKEDEILLEFAGARRPCYIIRNNMLVELPGSKNGIDKTEPRNCEAADPEYHTTECAQRLDASTTESSDNMFYTHIAKLHIGDRIYTFSDGFESQFGEKIRRKFLIKNVRQLLSSTASLPLEEQKEVLHTTLLQWQGSEAQTDDILLTCIEITPAFLSHLPRVS